MRRIIAAMLRGFGVRTIVEADNGADALDTVRQCWPDVIITDSVMPGMDGKDLVRAIRNPASKINCYVPIIMLTGLTEKGHVLDARDSGINDFVCKPVSVNTLYERIVAAIENPRPFVKTSDYFGPDWGQIRQAVPQAAGEGAGSIGSEGEWLIM